MIPYLHVRFSLLKEEKSPHFCFDCVWKNLFQMLPILSDSVLSTFSEWEEKATVTSEEAVILTARCHLHVDCVAKGRIVKYTIGLLSEQVFGSKKVAMSNLCKLNTSDEEHKRKEMLTQGTVTFAHLPTHRACLPELFLQRTPKHQKVQPANW